jgi:hypothetical protein
LSPAVSIRTGFRDEGRDRPFGSEENVIVQPVHNYDTPSQIMSTSSTRRTRALVGASAAAVALLAAPASALAVTGAATKPCISHVPTKGSEPLVVALSGGTPNGRYQVAATVPGKGSGSAGSVVGNIDATGSATAHIANVSVPRGTINPTAGRKVDLTVQDFTAGTGEVPIGSTRITNLTLDVSSKPRSPRAKRAVSVSGTPFANKMIYGFVTKPGSGRVLRKIPLGRGNVCGYVSARRVVGPKTFRSGSYRLYVNAGSTLNKRAALTFGFRITVL